MIWRYGPYRLHAANTTFDQRYYPVNHYPCGLYYVENWNLDQC